MLELFLYPVSKIVAVVVFGLKLQPHVKTYSHEIGIKVLGTKAERCMCKDFLVLFCTNGV